MKTTITPDEFVQRYPPNLQELANSLRGLVKATLPQVIETVSPGWGLLAYRIPVGSKSAYWGWIGAHEDHAHLGFEYGILLADPKKLLLGQELRRVRFVTIRRPREIRKRDFARFIHQASELAKLKNKRALLRLEQDALGARCLE